MSSYYTPLKTAMVNAWVIYIMTHEKSLSKKEFTEAVIEALAGKKYLKRVSNYNFLISLSVINATNHIVCHVLTNYMLFKNIDTQNILFPY